MGRFRYDGTEARFDDRLLAHLQIVIVQKFRMSESFTMSWVRSPGAGTGRRSVWLVPTAPIHFDFDGSRSPAISTQWLDVLMRSASSSRGLIITDEHGALAAEAGVR